MELNEILRMKIVDVDNKAVKLTRFLNLYEYLDDNCLVNCKGIGRIRKYEKFSLFMDNGNGTCKRLLRGVDPTLKNFQTQVFQIVGCNMRCWYCFVDDCVLAAKEENSEWITVSEMIDLFIIENTGFLILDLSGGQPDLVPEWCFWTMEEIEKRGLKNKVYIWVDDNLSTMNIMEKYLTKEQILYMAKYPKHSRACCFKGYNETSYRFNVRNNCLTFEEQISNFRKLYDYGFDIYAYVTMTGPKGCAKEEDIASFINKIRDIHPKLPLRVIPLKIKRFEATSKRMRNVYEEALVEQYKAYDVWKKIMSEIYKEELNLPYEKVNIYQ